MPHDAESPRRRCRRSHSSILCAGRAAPQRQARPRTRGRRHRSAAAPPTTGWCPARARARASRCSPTIRICGWRRRRSGTWRTWRCSRRRREPGQCRRRHAGRRAADRARSQRHAGLGLHQHRPRRAGPLHREDQSRQPARVPDARGLASRSRSTQMTIAVKGAACARSSAGARGTGPCCRASTATSRRCWRRATWRRCSGPRSSDDDTTIAAGMFDDRRARRRRLHRAHAPVHRADAEHGDRRRRPATSG